MDVRERRQMIKYTCGAGTPEEAETNCTYFIRGECTSSFCEYRRKKQTNADRIRAMNDEELAKKLEYELGCPVTGDCEKMYKDCKACWLDWLQCPAE